MPHPSTQDDVALLALQRRLLEERAEREALAHELDAAQAQLASLTAHHQSAVERAREIVELEGALAVSNARADAAVAHVTRLERELAEAQVAAEKITEVEPLPLRTPGRTRRQDWDQRTNVAAIAFVVGALIVVLVLVVLLT